MKQGGFGTQLCVSFPPRLCSLHESLSMAPPSHETISSLRAGTASVHSRIGVLETVSEGRNEPVSCTLPELFVNTSDLALTSLGFTHSAPVSPLRFLSLLQFIFQHLLYRNPMLGPGHVFLNKTDPAYVLRELAVVWKRPEMSRESENYNHATKFKVMPLLNALKEEVK